jgi:hypothetical protein
MEKPNKSPYYRSKAATVQPAPGDTDLLARADNQEGDVDEATPVVDPLPEFSLVVERLCILLLSILFICVPSLTIVAIPTQIIRNIALGASYAIPTTLLV